MNSKEKEKGRLASETNNQVPRRIEIELRERKKKTDSRRRQTE